MKINNETTLAISAASMEMREKCPECGIAISSKIKVRII
jgi:hypothetical protein